MRFRRPPVSSISSMPQMHRSAPLRGLCSGEGLRARASLVALELARALERSSDRLSLIGHVLHTHVMGELTK